MAGVEEQTDLELIKVLEFEPEVPCESSASAGEAADWYLTCRKCRFTFPLCEKHRALLVRDIAAAPFATLGCGLVGKTIDDLFEFVPIKRGHHDH